MHRGVSMLLSFHFPDLPTSEPFLALTSAQSHLVDAIKNNPTIQENTGNVEPPFLKNPRSDSVQF